MMTRVQHATTAPISGLDRVPFLGAARVRLERMVLSLTDPPGRKDSMNNRSPDALYASSNYSTWP
jgi:hypothetical protein